MIVLAAVLEGAFAMGILELSTFDVYVYRDYGEAMVGRAAPYRDFAVEYPPGSLALFVLPALVSDDLTAYQLFFADGMLVAATAMLAGVRRLERRVAGAGVATTSRSFAYSPSPLSLEVWRSLDSISFRPRSRWEPCSRLPPTGGSSPLLRSARRSP